MHTGFKIMIAIVVALVFLVIYLSFVGGTAGGAGSFLDNFWKGIEAFIPFK
jgi:hypothetical protein